MRFKTPFKVGETLRRVAATLFKTTERLFDDLNLET
jgi:hypothetical protein